MQLRHRVPRPARAPALLSLPLALLLAAGVAGAQEAAGGSLRQQMGAAEFRAAGLDKLSPAELAALEAWLQRRDTGNVPAEVTQAHVAQALVPTAPAAAAPAAPVATPAPSPAASAPAAPAVVDAAELERIREQAREEGRREVREESRGFFDFGSSEPITSTLVGEFRGFAKGRQYTLANGQVWEQIEPARLDGVRRQDPAVTIKPGLMNAWFLRVEGYNTPAKVRRIR